jgi:hypothetical protein
MQNSNGSSYLFTRTNLGKKTGILIGFVHYIYLPISVTYQLMQLVRALFSYEMVNTAGDAP